MALLHIPAIACESARLLLHLEVTLLRGLALELQRDGFRRKVVNVTVEFAYAAIVGVANSVKPHF